MASERITLTVPGPDGDREVGLSSPNRVLWPELGITKHELAEYLLAVSGPFLSANGDRAVSLERLVGSSLSSDSIASAAARRLRYGGGKNCPSAPVLKSSGAMATSPEKG